jgi:hypothetical protein
VRVGWGLGVAVTVPKMPAAKVAVGLLFWMVAALVGIAGSVSATVAVGEEEGAGNPIAGKELGSAASPWVINPGWKA